MDQPPGSFRWVNGVEALRSRLAEVRREIAATSEQLQRLRDEEYGLSLSLARMTGDPSPSPPDVESSRTTPTSGKARITPAVRALLAESSSPLTRMEIVGQLGEDGISTSPDAVSASLSYLRKQGTAINAGGRWYLSHQPTGSHPGAQTGPV